MVSTSVEPTGFPDFAMYAMQRAPARALTEIFSKQNLIVYASTASLSVAISKKTPRDLMASEPANTSSDPEKRAASCTTHWLPVVPAFLMRLAQAFKERAAFLVSYSLTS